jgi:hypothetical protein
MKVKALEVSAREAGVAVASTWSTRRNFLLSMKKLIVSSKKKKNYSTVTFNT